MLDSSNLILQNKLMPFPFLQKTKTKKSNRIQSFPFRRSIQKKWNVGMRSSFFFYARAFIFQQHGVDFEEIEDENFLAGKKSWSENIRIYACKSPESDITLARPRISLISAHAHFAIPGVQSFSMKRENSEK